MIAPLRRDDVSISVVIPTFNGSRYITECIASVLHQPVNQLEVIVCDGGSTDDTVEVVKSISRTDRRVRIHTSSTRVPIEANWTRACELGQYNFIKLLCQDDLVSPDALAAQALALMTRPDAVAVTGPRSIIDAKGRTILRRRGGRGLSYSQSGRQALRATILSGGNILGEPSALLFRNSVLQRCLPWSTRFPYLLDLEMYARVFQFGEVLSLPQVVASFRVHDTSWSLALSKQHSHDYNAWVDWVYSSSLAQEKRGDRVVSQFRASLSAMARSAIYRTKVSQ